MNWVELSEKEFCEYFVPVYNECYEIGAMQTNELRLLLKLLKLQRKSGATADRLYHLCINEIKERQEDKELYESNIHGVS